MLNEYIMKNWNVMTRYDELWATYGYSMRKSDWEWCETEGEQFAKVFHLAFRKALEQKCDFAPAPSYGFCGTGLANRFGSRFERIATSSVRCVIYLDGKHIMMTHSSVYTLEGDMRPYRYETEPTDLSDVEIEEAMKKFFVFPEVQFADQLLHPGDVVGLRKEA